jgi:hypothetical protein
VTASTSIDIEPLDISFRAKLRRWWDRHGPRPKIVALAAVLALAAGYLHHVLIPSQGRAAELKQRDGIRAEVGRLLDARDYAGLEELAAGYRDGAERTQSGVWKLTVFYSGFHAKARFRDKGDPGWKTLSDRLRDWQVAYPDSPTPVVANAVVMKRYAMALKPLVIFQRASTADDDEAFIAALMADKAYLERHKTVAARDPHFYVIWSNLAFALGADAAEFFDIVEEGLSRHPAYYQLYFAAMDYQAPSIRGNAEAVEAFANMAVERTRDQEGLSLYARVYWAAMSAYFGEDLFRRSRINWARMRDGIDDVLKRYPDQWNINNFALVACLAGDAAKTRALLDRIEGRPIPEVWGVSGTLQSCRRLAQAE